MTTKAMTAPAAVPEEPQRVPGLGQGRDHQRRRPTEAGDREVVPSADAGGAQLRGNSSLMTAGAIEAISAYSPRPVQKTTISENRLSCTRNDSGTMSTASAPDQTSSCGRRPKRSDMAPNG